MKEIDDTGAIVPEPDWQSMFDDVLEVGAAREHWRVITTELKGRLLMSPGNAHALQRLVSTYIFHDRAQREVAEHGSVTKPKRGNSKAIARVSPHFTVMREMASDAAVLEAEFGLSPRRRATATKSETAKKAPKPSDAYLRPVAKG